MNHAPGVGAGVDKRVCLPYEPLSELSTVPWISPV